MTYEEIKKAIVDQGLNWNEAAEAIGITASHLCNVSSRRADSRPVAKQIALLLGKPISKVFPDKPNYTKDPKLSREERIEAAKKILAQG